MRQKRKCLGITARLARQQLAQLLFDVAFDRRRELGAQASLGNRKCVGHEVAHNRVHVAAVVADFGELGRLDFDKRRVDELGNSSRQFRFADTGWTDHKHVLWRDFIAQKLLRVGEPTQRDATAQRRTRVKAHIPVRHFADAIYCAMPRQ